MPDVTIRERTLEAGDIDLYFLEAGEGPLVVLSHGFPELSYSWRHQIPALVRAGYHVVAPDQRGYGKTGRPDSVEDYDIHHLTRDLITVLDEVGEEKAVFVGHDWGSIVVSHEALLHPDRVAGLVNMSVPHIARAPAAPIAIMRRMFRENFFYMIYFQEPGIADVELGDDPARTMRRLLAGAIAGEGGMPDPSMFAPDPRGFIDRLPEPDALPDWISQDELDHYIAEFARTGFTGGLNWYRNLDRNWETTEDLAGAVVSCPSSFIAGSRDPVLFMSPPTAAHASLKDHRFDAVLPGAGHWVQQEQPEAVNAQLVRFLAQVHNR